MKNVKNTLILLLLIVILFLPSNTIYAQAPTEEEIEAYVYDRFGGTGELTINQDDMEELKNAPKEGGTYPLEITVVDNGESAVTTIYVTVKPAVDIEENEDEYDESFIGPIDSNRDSIISIEETEKELEAEIIEDVNENFFSDDVKILRVDDNRKFRIVLFLSFLFAIFLILMLIVLYYLFRKLQKEVKNEVDKLNII